MIDRRHTLPGEFGYGPSLRRNKVGIKAPIHTPVRLGLPLRQRRAAHGAGPLRLRRPARATPERPRCRTGTEIDWSSCAREKNTEDLTSAIEFEHDREDTARMIETIREFSGPGAVFGQGLRPLSNQAHLGLERASRASLQSPATPRKRKGAQEGDGRHKANIMKFTDGLFLAVASEVAAEKPGIEFKRPHRGTT